MVKPVCSNCILYQSECKTGAAKRKQYSHPGKPIPSSHVTSPSGDSRRLEARLKQLEHRLTYAANSSTTPDSTPPSRATSQNDGISSDDMATDAVPRLNQFSSKATGARALGLVEPSVYDAPALHSMPLPPREELLPVIDYYFHNTNSVIPLFHQASFMRLLDAWYSNPATRSRAKWAAIHIVMALGLRTPEPVAREISFETVQRANAHLNKAQSVLSELVIHDEDLLGIQVLLGIVILFQNSSDQKPSSVIIASVIRLAHRLSLHSRKFAQGFSDQEALQRSRVFWIAYTLDKEISIRVKTPSIQSDNDIDLPLPAARPSDGAGLIRTRDGGHEINSFRFRVELAHIHGKIYDLLYSNRAAIITRTERRQLIAQIQVKLGQWCDRIPVAFGIDHVSSVVSPVELVHMTKLHHSYLMAEIMTHGFYSHDAAWIKSISSVSSITMNDLTSTQDRFGVARGDTGQDPPSTSGWNKLVEISRGCLKLFHSAAQFECLVWQCSCGHFSSLMVLLANMFLHPSHPCGFLDQHLTAKSIEQVDNILQVTHDKALESIGEIVRELSNKAADSVESHKLRQDAKTSDIFQEFIPEWDMPSMLQDWGCATFTDGPSIPMDSLGTGGLGTIFD